MRHRLAVVLLAASAALVLVACTSKPAASLAPVSNPTAVSAPVSAMSIDQKRSLIATNFQIEVPVPMGTVVRGESQGDAAWDYELIVAAPPATVAQWYRTAFAGAEWKLDRQTGSGQGATILTLTKNAAQTRVTITPEGVGRSRAQAVIGIGTPVLQTQ